MYDESRSPLEKLHDWCTPIEDGEAYILWVIARRKYNDDITNSTEIIHRRVLTDEDDIEYNYNHLKYFAESSEHHFRMYVTVNKRDVLKGFWHMQSKMLDLSKQITTDVEGAYPAIGRLGSMWKSVLHSPKSREEKMFLFDIDEVDSGITVTEEDAYRFTAALAKYTEVLWLNQTPNGYHVITQPFNYNDFEAPFEYSFATDGATFIEELG